MANDSTTLPSEGSSQEVSTAIPHTSPPAEIFRLTAQVSGFHYEVPIYFGSTILDRKEGLFISCSLNGVSSFACEKVVTIWTGGGRPLFGGDISGDQLREQSGYGNLQWSSSSFEHEDEVRQYRYSTIDPLRVVVLVHLTSGRQLLFQSEPLAAWYPTVTPDNWKKGHGLDLLFTLVIGETE